ncbi:hypothetical protein [Rhizobium multihospitium]|uniref:hypothetical protein n=1 Tax=Rhizobium multihospitium TaxID=410764 RepID=UPI00142E8770|nr:hypothetical protein [Rhizobium multihospitium]
MTKSRLTDHGLHTPGVVNLGNSTQKTGRAIMLPLEHSETRGLTALGIGLL